MPPEVFLSWWQLLSMWWAACLLTRSLSNSCWAALLELRQTNSGRHRGHTDGTVSSPSRFPAAPSWAAACSHEHHCPLLVERAGVLLRVEVGV